MPSTYPARRKAVHHLRQPSIARYWRCHRSAACYWACGWRASAKTWPRSLVLFTLEPYQSPPPAGAVAFCSLFPGLLLSPLAGALLDGHGRTRLIVLDLLVLIGALVPIAGAWTLALLQPWLLMWMSRCHH
jgi:MFS family permease